MQPPRACNPGIPHRARNHQQIRICGFGHHSLALANGVVGLLFGCAVLLTGRLSRCVAFVRRTIFSGQPQNTRESREAMSASGGQKWISDATKEMQLLSCVNSVDREGP
jgi:hypothetical protein